MQAIFLVMFALLRCSLIEKQSTVERLPAALLGVTMSWGMGGVAMNSLISVPIVWHVLDVISMSPETQTVGSGSKPETLCSRCFKRFLSAMTSAQQLMEICK